MLTPQTQGPPGVALVTVLTGGSVGAPGRGRSGPAFPITRSGDVRQGRKHGPGRVSAHPAAWRFAASSDVHSADRAAPSARAAGFGTALTPWRG